jgi:hypothetical protein
MPAKFYLVEEHVNEMCYGPETIVWHAIVEAEGRMEAMRLAEQKHREDLNHGLCKAVEGHVEWTFAFSDDELEVWVPDYAWVANDGSSIWYEVRLLGEPVVDTPMYASGRLEGFK